MTKREKLSLQKRLRGVTMPIRRKRMRWLRNWNCLCGSGRKYKVCCMQDIESLTVVDGNSDIPCMTNKADWNRKIRDLVIQGDGDEG